MSGVPPWMPSDSRDYFLLSHGNVSGRGKHYICSYYISIYYYPSVDVVWHLLKDMVELAQWPISHTPVPRLWTSCTCSLKRRNRTVNKGATVGKALRRHLNPEGFGGLVLPYRTRQEVRTRESDTPCISYFALRRSGPRHQPSLRPSSL